MFRLLLLLLSLSFVSASLSAGPEESAPTALKPERAKWESLSEKDREKLRVALREVWTDPAVLSAREEVKLASEAYQEAIRQAVAKSDPTLVDLLAKVQEGNEGTISERMKGDGPGRFGPGRGFEYPTGPPAFLEKLTAEERVKFKEAEETARNAPKVLEAKKEMEQLRAQDEQIRKKRMEAHLKMRRAVLEAMFEENPELKKLQPRLEFTPGGKGGKGRLAPGQRPEGSPRSESGAAAE